MPTESTKIPTAISEYFDYLKEACSPKFFEFAERIRSADSFESSIIKELYRKKRGTDGGYHYVVSDEFRGRVRASHDRIRKLLAEGADGNQDEIKELRKSTGLLPAAGTNENEAFQSAAIVNLLYFAIYFRVLGLEISATDIFERIKNLKRVKSKLDTAVNAAIKIKNTDSDLVDQMIEVSKRVQLAIDSDEEMIAVPSVAIYQRKHTDPKLRFFAAYLLSKTERLFGQPMSNIVAILVNILFDRTDVTEDFVIGIVRARQKGKGIRPPD